MKEYRVFNKDGTSYDTGHLPLNTLMLRGYTNVWMTPSEMSEDAHKRCVWALCDRIRKIILVKEVNNVS